jgi:diaminohydroxyphosphoribosylaminopyrimidine deaminase/5-amino-6-(5-phosphoribosylamino)uracil reductase
MEAEARALNPGFIKRMQQGLPLVRVKLAMSLDGRTAMASGESQWITGAPARADVQRLRASSCAIITGIETVLSDDAALTVRPAELGLENAEFIARRQPLRVVVDSALRIPLQAKVLAGPGQSLVVSAHDDFAVAARLAEQGVEHSVLATADGQVDLSALLKLLAERQCNEVLVEAGATLAGAFWQQGLVDRLTVYMAPTLLGSRARPLLQLPFDSMAQQQRLDIESITPVGDDWRIEARLKH